MRIVDAHTVKRRTLESFGYEWTRFAKVHTEDLVFWQRYFADVDLSLLRGRLGLDAGCGNGRFSRITAPYLEALVAIDGSDATTVAATNLADRPNASVVKCDLEAMPFEAGSFGFIFCLGVLHHLTLPQVGLGHLVDVLASDGLILIYLYSRPESFGLRSLSLHASSLLRRITVRMPRFVLRPLCWPLAVVLYAAFVVPGAVGTRLHIKGLAGIPLATYRRSPLRSLWLDTFDRLSAPLESRFTPAEVESLFEECGLSPIALRTDPSLAGIVVLGERTR